MKAGYLFGLVLLLLLNFSCKDHRFDYKSIISEYNQGKFDNSLMLIKLEELRIQQPENIDLLNEYVYRMVWSGYSSKIVSEIINGDIIGDTNVIVSSLEKAMKKGLVFELATFNGFEYSPNFNFLTRYKIYHDSIVLLNERTKSKDSIKALIDRGVFFMGFNHELIAQTDFKRVLKTVPCEPNANFYQSVFLVKNDQFEQLQKNLKNCIEEESNQNNWMAVFLDVANEILEIERSDLSNEKKQFSKAKVLANHSFHDEALKKTLNLIKNNNKNADYYALTSFIYYQLSDKKNAERYLSLAESISGQTNSNLRTMIEQLN